MQDGAALIKKYFPDLSPEQELQFGRLQELYEDWNSKINVISRKDIDELYVRHVLHSLGIAKVQPFLAGAQIMDVGTGGGFPGIPLAILFPQASFYLVDSIGKKISVVQGVAEALGLQNVRAEQIRAEQVKGQFDFVVSRAVTRMKPFIGWVEKKVKQDSKHPLYNGILYLKGGDLDEELDETGLNYAIYNLPDFFEEEFFETKKVVYVPL
ncbi:16S rRNA (guanine(527)-N(7))-methyltransferase RsmG [Cesiribacter andamanensis]|uniref:Ribosomal RNA small subunit methyltransferase G n=1 Tax=Cesiribacter andamanensis AMV16 TaxID=1279009 RepID=M7NN25_9BACT|nr:16S rRNA (guanine(527)-N(7))-methyltransferase RsmG [Cesiribacter andamanensis]EMR03145.1 Ribosomal RNA small subunit methyltransferase G [Cesiribacter andamanensis AMV16]